MLFNSFYLKDERSAVDAHNVRLHEFAITDFGLEDELWKVCLKVISYVLGLSRVRRRLTIRSISHFAFPFTAL